MSQVEQVKVFRDSLRKGMSTYEVKLSPAMLDQLGAYYELLLRWNERLHLVAPCSAEEFARRHVLESLTLTKHFTPNASVIDIGSGAGLPIIPCLIVRPDLKTTLIESSQKKSVFLREALKTVGALKRATIVSKPFDSLSAPNAEYVTCRALDDFSEAIASLVRWAPTTSTLLLFGGPTLRQSLDNLNLQTTETLLPNSDRRFLFEVTKA
ncbi:MAG TPA: 16S rRNA (guanine(527)-N(7))-methyltransferase RsmG [Pyrinomonadaceae bacterium]|nr:16S rRNA (guanine(527)-N(7))-methyltransferase RsmG [Pyrinomonadaceae bacterium]